MKPLVALLLYTSFSTLRPAQLAETTQASLSTGVSLHPQSQGIMSGGGLLGS